MIDCERRRAMATALFTGGDDCTQGYRNIRDAKDGPLRSARFHCEYLWIFFERHADKDFRSQLRTQFDARYWEMHLTTSLILAGYEVTCPKPGPDVGIIDRGQRIWFEATSPNCGEPGKPDHIGPPYSGQVPEEKIMLRYLNSISTKYKEQYANWLAKGTVSSKDALVVAINPWAIPFDRTDGDPPRILQAAYTVGKPYAVVDCKTMTGVGSGYEFRDHVKKEKNPSGKGVSVATGVFHDKDYAGLSALLCSRVEVANRPGEMGGDFQLAPNPNAAVPLPEGFRLRGTYYDVKAAGDSYQITPVQCARSIVGAQGDRYKTSKTR
jgi:hypothetical protein